MSSGIVDWGLGRRVAGAVAGDGSERGIDRAAAGAACEQGLERVLAYTGLEPLTEVPGAEVVTRGEWIEANLAELRNLAAPLERRAQAEIPLPGPIAGIARAALGAASGVEAGAVLGYAARRVLGQYHLSLGDRERAPRLLLVGPNLGAARRELDADEDRFLLWVAIHEQTHSVQFASVPWLREHLSGLLRRLIETASDEVDLRALAGRAKKLVSTDPRRVLREVLRGELTRALAGPGQLALIDEIQATMAVIEGYAEHVMDAALADDRHLASMRARIDARRARRAGLAEIIARALGLGMKLRQYELGKAWCDGVVAEAGIGGLNRAWEDAGALPTPAELEAPSAWVARVVTPAAA